ncbi:MAG TPA: hypothetical protein VMW68_03190 [Methyloceanibacter sp.]|nr:hypothetical protein [Methyloceanibacter sp.]
MSPLEHPEKPPEPSDDPSSDTTQGDAAPVADAIEAHDALADPAAEDNSSAPENLSDLLDEPPEISISGLRRFRNRTTH